MVGEFEGPGGKPYVMAVSLSLEKSAKFTLQTTHPFGIINLVSAMDGSPLPLRPEQGGCWLTAGQGVLIALEP